MEELNFIQKSSDTRIYFTADAGAMPLPWPVPRVGEIVSVRGVKGGLDKHIRGEVLKVDWYFSTGNRGPVVTVEVA